MHTNRKDENKPVTSNTQVESPTLGTIRLL
jgi:hypothetical protein